MNKPMNLEPIGTHPVIDTTPTDDFRFESKYVEVLGSQMHYIDVGEGRPIVFLHGNPMSNYLWRNIIPHLQGGARCIAPDLIGMGKSDHPDIAYTYDDQYRYLCAFLDRMDLGDDVTLVIHDWGSGLGLRWAADHPERMRAIAFMEAMVNPLSLKRMPAQLRVMFPLMRTKLFEFLMIRVLNLFLRVMIQDLTHGRISKQALAHYRAHYPTIRSRQAVEQWPREVPLDGKPPANYAVQMNFRRWLQDADIPKLMLHGDEGVAIQAEEIRWCRDELSNIRVVDLGPGKHFLQETHPERIGQELARWFGELA
jgi:haloalkane dehalogenase